MPRQALQPEGMAEPKSPYSPVVVAGRALPGFLTAQIPSSVDMAPRLGG